jgi:hypothetical protein
MAMYVNNCDYIVLDGFHRPVKHKQSLISDSSSDSDVNEEVKFFSSLSSQSKRLKTIDITSPTSMLSNEKVVNANTQTPPPCGSPNFQCQESANDMFTKLCRYPFFVGL